MSFPFKLLDLPHLYWKRSKRFFRIFPSIVVFFYPLHPFKNEAPRFFDTQINEIHIAGFSYLAQLHSPLANARPPFFPPLLQHWPAFTANLEYWTRSLTLDSCRLQNRSRRWFSALRRWDAYHPEHAGLHQCFPPPMPVAFEFPLSFPTYPKNKTCPLCTRKRRICPFLFMPRPFPCFPPSLSESR